MKIYFAADNQAEEKLQKQFSRIVDILNKAGVVVMSNLIQKNIKGFSSQDLEKIGQSGEVLLEKMDALIIESTRMMPESGYLIALALTHKKPILCIAPVGNPVNNNLSHLQRDKDTAKFLISKNYTENNLEKILNDFLQTIEQEEGRQAPSIKFTLRVTPRIERYLSWKINNTNLTKADYLRNLIEDIIDADIKYQKFVRHDY